MGDASFSDFEALVRRCRRGDDDAWHKLIARFRALVRSISAKAGLSHDEAEDVFQHTALSLFDSLPRIRTAQTLPRWIATTAARECLRLRKERSRDEEDIQRMDTMLSAEPSPEDVVIQNAVANDLRAALSLLPEREMVLLHQLFLKECSYKDIVDAGFLPQGAIGPTRSRALARLRSYIDKTHG